MYLCSGDKSATTNVKNLSFEGCFLVVFAVSFTSLGGMVVASILKMLDNVVKEYSSCIANTLTAIVCSVLFPSSFTFTPSMILAIFLLFSGICLYESKEKCEHMEHT